MLLGLLARREVAAAVMNRLWECSWGTSGLAKGVCWMMGASRDDGQGQEARDEDCFHGRLMQVKTHGIQSEKDQAANNYVRKRNECVGETRKRAKATN